MRRTRALFWLCLAAPVVVMGAGCQGCGDEDPGTPTPDEIVSPTPASSPTPGATVTPVPTPAESPTPEVTPTPLEPTPTPDPATVDHDGDGYSLAQGDCDDTARSIHPGATEACNAIDDDCNNQIDEGVKNTYYADIDLDGYGDPAAPGQACSASQGMVADNTDCDDASGSIHPFGTEVCNGLDDDCDSQIDEGVKSAWYADTDQDSYGSLEASTLACAAPQGYVADATDCDDTRGEVHPTATETCNGLDDDCNAQIDEGVKTTYYQDADLDGYGAPKVSTQGCSAPSGYVADGTDCDDVRTGVHPGATEACNGLDDDCNAQIDEGVKSTFYVDADQDGYGDVKAPVQACKAPAGYVADSTDCDDTQVSIYPTATEVCNGRDENCNTQIDEGMGSTWYPDADEDGYGDEDAGVPACTAPPGYLADNGDCDDTDPDVYPDAYGIVGEGLDTNCDGPEYITTAAGTGGSGYTGDGGQATAAQFSLPTGVAFDGQGNLFIVDEGNYVVRKVSPSGIVTTVAGSGASGFSGDGGPATSAKLSGLFGLEVDAQGNIFIADQYNNRIRKVNTAGIITTVAGSASGGYSGDGGPATSAKLNFPVGVAVDGQGNLFIADYYNNCVRKVNAGGTITTFAGNGTGNYSGDNGAATSATLYRPTDVAFDSQGRLFISDQYNNRVRMVSAGGIITTVAGSGTPGYGGDGAAATSARLNLPIGVSIDASDNLFIADYSSSRVRKVDAAGIITTVAGTGTSGFSGDGGAPTSARLSGPVAVVSDSLGNLFIAEISSCRVRMIHP